MFVKQTNSVNGTLFSYNQQLVNRISIGFEDETEKKKETVVTVMPSLSRNKNIQQEAFVKMQLELAKIKEKEQERAKDFECIAKKDYRQLNAVKAAQYGILERLKELVESREFNPFKSDIKKIDIKSSIGGFKEPTLLHWAAYNNRLDIVKYLLSLGANINEIGGELSK